MPAPPSRPTGSQRLIRRNRKPVSGDLSDDLLGLGDPALSRVPGGRGEKAHGQASACSSHEDA